MCAYIQYQRLIRDQQEQTRQMFEAEKERAVGDLKAEEEHEEFKKKVALCYGGVPSTQSGTKLYTYYLHTHKQTGDC